MHTASFPSVDLRRIRESPLLDPVIGGSLALLALVQVMFEGASGGYLLGSLLATAPHAMRRRHPWPTVLLTLMGAIVLAFGRVSSGEDIPVAVWLSGVLSAYTVLRRLTRPAGLGVGALAIVAGAGAGLRLPNLALGLAMIFAVVLVTDLLHSRKKIGQVRQDGLEQVIAAQREQAAMAERARIARELHDVVAHSISMVAVQAEAAPYTVDDLSDAAKAEFAEIATTARGTLTEMRRLLGVLRADIPTAPETAPQPGLEQLAELIERHDGEVDLDVIGEQAPLPSAVDVSAYRIVQECLANARTHAPGSRVSIELAYRPNLLAIRVANDAPTPASTQGSGGHGLIGMRERALGLGGWFAAEPIAGGGFLVRAGLPLE